MAEPTDPKTFNPQTLIDLLGKLGAAAPLVAAFLQKLLEMFQSSQGGGGFIAGAGCDHAACCDACIEAQCRALCLMLQHRQACGD